MIKLEKTSQRPTVFLIRFAGLLTLAETQTDAFVISSPTARMQIARLARKRAEALGAVHFFDDLAAAQAFLRA